MPRCLTRISLALVLLLSGEVWALGLGELRLDSALNEPLRAEIELVAASPEELQNLQVGLASAETFERYGLERPYYLQNLVFEVVRSGRADGNYVRVRSAAPMTEPFLTFLIEATWSSGRLLREYTVLLDPPTFAPQDERAAQPEMTAPRPAAPADSGRIERAEPEPEPERQAPAAAAQARPAAPVQAPAAETGTAAEPAPVDDEAVEDEPAGTAPFDAAAGDEVTVVRGDTLWGIASRIRPDSRVTMNQTMLAIFEANPEAFGGNINILRAGARLAIPSADEIYRIDRTEAFNEAVRQNDAWQGGAVPAPAVAAEPTPEPESRPSLTLVPPDDEPAGAGTEVTGEIAEEIAEEPTAGEPAAAGREQEILDRIAELEAADVPVQESLIQIRDNELANLRRELADIRGEDYEAPVEAADEPLDEPFVEDEEAPDAEPAEGELFPEFDETPEDETVAGEPDATPAETEPAIRIRRDEAPSLLDTILGWLTSVWALLGILLLAVIGILVWFMRRGGGDEPDAWHARMDAGDSPDETLAATESLRAPSRHDESIVVVEQTGRFRKRDREADTVETRAPVIADDATGGFGSLEDTFSSETAVNLDQSDPIAEADFHMAYGLYDQAADLVNGALQSEPERQDLLTKLCEIYFVWGNRDAFVAAAERLHAVTDDRQQSDDWDKIVIMGQQIAPDHALFAGVAGGTRAVDLSFEDEDAGSTGALDMDFGAGDSGGDEVIDLGGGVDEGGDEDGIDFVFDDDPASAKTVEMRAAEPTIETPTLEQQFSALEGTGRHRAGSPGGEARAPRPTDATTEIDLDDLGLDLDGMAETEFAALGDDDATELASLDDLDDLDRTGTNESIEDADERVATGRNPEVAIDDSALVDVLDLDDDDFTSTRTGMRLAPDETGVNPAQTLAEETGLDEDLLAATGRTQVLPEDYAVETFGDDAPLGDDDRTMLASSLRNEDFDFAKTEALPPGTYPGDDDATGEIPALASTDMDLDLDDLTEALMRTDKGDTVEQPRDDRTVEHRRPDIDEETDETLAFAPDDLSDELEEARTMTEVGTKLDLARAYVDMGDPAGARSILEEVLDEGDSSQRQQAQRLLDSLPS